MAASELANLSKMVLPAGGTMPLEVMRLEEWPKSWNFGIASGSSSRHVALAVRHTATLLRRKYFVDATDREEWPIHISWH